MVLLIFIVPVVCIGLGVLMVRNIPASPNMVFGFRTKRASSSHAAWRYANVLAGKLLLIVGIVFTAIGIFLFAIPNMISAQNMDSAMELYCLILLLCVIISAVFVQIALCKRFDTNGNRKSMEL